ncbi:MAG: tRNA-dihydrouridine synthase family protein [Anabaena sp. CoA2_C59]|jgi:nifR3 family TIM-barrel protein|uniref:tRNA-dihydrouridine synthase n=2 Tax=Aphanizomenon flos-aquae TaxID=1176 RepID=A0A1B7WXL7_APHFL|nr:tRNA-dihydrouridine synthase family protein [Aphanizomenon flos-aquae Clear-A1]MBO1043446.1 tRNA-dihydrouridine synthase family protein [Aphanizomenon flos-aquae UKL13-PB]MCE2906260.1 tRNA-dihydrouridine synthase family protein [Anabaena sp. CoA2_C59]MDJ0506787.1 tRNA-dihydrouridine synthase family protein [Nostocales cyanobacterium LE14-WE12]NTW21344.1 tRNA-dihydrouridine synthase family protein [Nostocales cyanobacterium W4_Combined_metabat2_030]OBQ24478.1 MAG: dihydrouridine synthase [An
MSQVALPQSLEKDLPFTALAPMQDVTNLWFMKVISQYGSPDYFFTEYFRVNDTSRLNRGILAAITENDTGRPVFAQMIGESIPDLVRTAKELCKYNIAGVDLNMGCPAPRIYRKNVGGGLLREPEKVDRILGELRAAVNDRPLTVKMRLGFENTDNFYQILDIINHHNIDLLSLHGRTVKDMYHGAVKYDLIAEAVRRVHCPVMANGNINSAKTALEVLSQTGAAGVMVGRWAIGNPWLFHQIRQALEGKEITPVPLVEVRNYIDCLWKTPTASTMPERARVGYLKMFLNYIALSIDTEGDFLRLMRRAQNEVELFSICDRFLLVDVTQTLALAPVLNV